MSEIHKYQRLNINIFKYPIHMHDIVPVIFILLIYNIGARRGGSIGSLNLYILFGGAAAGPLADWIRWIIRTVCHNQQIN